MHRTFSSLVEGVLSLNLEGWGHGNRLRPFEIHQLCETGTILDSRNHGAPQPYDSALAHRLILAAQVPQCLERRAEALVLQFFGILPPVNQFHQLVATSSLTSVGSHAANQAIATLFFQQGMLAVLALGHRQGNGQVNFMLGVNQDGAFVPDAETLAHTLSCTASPTERGVWRGRFDAGLQASAADTVCGRIREMADRYRTAS